MKSIFTFFICVIVCNNLNAQIRLPRIIRDSMILQRGTDIKIWGWASKSEKVRIQFNQKIYRVKTSDDGRWLVNLSPMKAGGPYTMVISGRNKIVLQDILIGDVWVCAGQSNMEHQMKLHAVKYSSEMSAANYSEIRQFKIPNVTDLTGPQTDLTGGSWKWANPVDVKDFSAVAYFFATALYEKYHVPIGIINASWGGIPIESMMSEACLTGFPSIKNIVEKNKDTAYVGEVNRKAFADAQAIPQPDDKGMDEKWFNTLYATKDWKPIAIPGYWENQGAKNLNGIVWYRKEIDIPDSIVNKPSRVFLGRIVDADELYVNGKEVGATGYLYPQRRYQLPAGTLHPGRNLFVIRVTCLSGRGGFVPDKPYQLIAGGDTIDLTGYWQYKAGFMNIPRELPDFNAGITIQNQPCALYNSMIAPVTNYSISGFVWYQGESNTYNPDAYAKLQPAMIADWRVEWNQGELPFLFVQLPGFGDYHYLPSESQWALFREAQAKSLRIPNTYMAVAIDIGEWNDVHPDRKKEVGERLALAAEKTAYKQNVVFSGPTYQSSTVEGNQIVISFRNTGSGLTTSDNEAPAEFAIAGADKKFVWAETKIDNDRVIVWSDQVKAPKYVRYAWSDTPVNPNLYNKENLPASPFRTGE
jgi:sialate O-acetylesterase